MTSICMDSADSKSIAVGSATVTSPVLASISKAPPASSEREYFTESVPSRSVAVAVTPTLVPALADSDTEFAAVSASLLAVTENSDVSSVSPMSKVLVEVEPSDEVAVTSICMDCADSKSMAVGSATVTSPVSASMVNAPPASSDNE